MRCKLVEREAVSSFLLPWLKLLSITCERSSTVWHSVTGSADQSRKRQLPYKELCTSLVLANLSQGHSPWAKAMRLPCTVDGGGEVQDFSSMKCSAKCMRSSSSTSLPVAHKRMESSQAFPIYTAALLRVLSWMWATTIFSVACTRLPLERGSRNVANARPLCEAGHGTSCCYELQLVHGSREETRF